MKNIRKNLFGILSLALAVLLIVGFTSVCLAAEEGTDAGIISVGLTLDDSITVRFNTSATENDGSKVVVSFGGNDYELTAHKNGVFLFAGVTPQNLNADITAKMYAADGTQLGEAVTFNTRSYLESLLALSFEDSGCATVVKYTAMKELAVNMLNYGAAAQVYTGTDVENLANKNLTAEQKALATAPITVSESDTKIDGSAWVGAGVRFDYRLGLYFVFEAPSLKNVTATVNGVKVTPDIYDSSRNLYIIRYSAFDVTQMNDVVTAKLVVGGKEQTLEYSVKSYVASMGKDDSALAKLVNAAYAYGYAAVAYSGDLVLVTAPTFESEGYVGVDSKGYDFTGTPYASINLPKLDTENYTTSVSRAGDVNPTVSTVFTYSSDSFEYSVTLKSTDCIYVCRNGQTIGASKYDYEKLNTDIVTVTYDEKTGYTYTVADGQTETGIDGIGVRTYGNMLTIVGNMELNLTSRWGHNYGLTIGTPDKAANVSVANTASDYGIVLWDGADLNVAEGSTLVVTGTSDNSICGYAGGSYVTIDGTVTLDKSVNIKYNTVWVHPYGDNYGLNPTLYVRKGTLTIKDGTLRVNMLQVGSLKEGYKGTLNIRTGGDAIAANTTSKGFRYAFSNGEVNLTCYGSGKTGMVLSATASAYVWYDAGITVNVALEGSGTMGNFMGEWNANSSYDYRVSVHSDAKFNLPAGTTQFFRAGTAAKCYSNVWSTATINIDGVEKTVCIANAHTYNTAKFDITSAGLLTVDNGDGTKSAAAVAPVEGATYVTGTATTYVSDWTFTEATYTADDGTVYTIYYKNFN